MKGFSDKETVDALIQSLKDSGNQNYSFLRFDGIGHAYTNDEFHNKNYNAKVAEESFEATIQFFNKNL
jgi:dienelactone hydrolase